MGISSFCIPKTTRAHEGKRKSVALSGGRKRSSRRPGKTNEVDQGGQGTAKGREGKVGEGCQRGRFYPSERKEKGEVNQNGKKPSLTNKREEKVFDVEKRKRIKAPYDQKEEKKKEDSPYKVILRPKGGKEEGDHPFST